MERYKTALRLLDDAQHTLPAPLPAWGLMADPSRLLEAPGPAGTDFGYGLHKYGSDVREHRLDGEDGLCRCEMTGSVFEMSPGAWMECPGGLRPMAQGPWFSRYWAPGCYHPDR